MLSRIYAPRPVPEAQATPDPPASDDARRDDGRTCRELQPVVLRTGVNAESAGSAFLELGKTKVVCLVNGPRSLMGAAASYSDTGSLSCDLRFAPFARAARKAMAQDAEDRALSSALSNALSPAVLLDRYPKASIEVVALVLEDDGVALSAAITCATAALLDAGIELRDVVLACSLGSTAEGRTLMDPTGAEADLLARQTTVACMPGLGQITHLEHRGQGTVAATAAATRGCVAGCAARGQDLRRVLAQSLEAPLRRAVQEMSRSRE